MSCRYAAPSIGLLLLGLLPLATKCHAADPAPKDANFDVAAANVADALQAEAEGDFLARQRLLAEADQAVDFAPAKWHQGMLKAADGTWVDIETSMESVGQDVALAEYERRRAGLTDNLQNHLTLAQWCAQQKLLDQSRSHLARVLSIDPDNVVARRALGYQLVNGEWISPEELLEIVERTENARESMRQFGSKLTAIGRRMKGTKRNQEVALEELAAIDDPQAVPAVEAVFATALLEPTLVAIEWLDQHDTVEASQALARFSLFHPEEKARYDAASRLSERPLHDFVPDLLTMLASPVNTMIVPVFDRNGDFSGYQQAFAQEKFDQTELVLVNRRFVRDSISLRTTENFARGPMARVANRAITEQLNEMVEEGLREFSRMEASTRSQALQRDNAQQEQRNARVAEVLSQVAAKEFSGEAREMWEWWDAYNETAYQEYKPERYRRTSLADRVPQYLVESPRTCECFVAGTKVVTRRGMKKIDEVAVGDTVLSRNVGSGELSWKPVLAATNRPPENTLTIKTGDESFTCTTGHLFWVSGKGWKKASELIAGDILHAAKEPAIVEQVIRHKVLPTFNLEVADNGTYFVGKSMVMTHDVTPRRHNRDSVPGQRLVLALKK